MRANEYARARGHSLEETLLERGHIDADALDTARRGHAEEVVLCMFSWRTGEFSFEVRMVQPSEGGELFIEPGLNPQFLALEGTRQYDESEHGMGVEAPVGEAGATAELVDAEFVDPLGDMTLDSLDAEPEITASPDTGPAVDDALAGIAEAEPVPAEVEPVPAQAGVEEAVVALEASQESAPPSPPAGPPPPLVVIDSSLPVLEWVKTSLEAADSRIHVFQTSELGISRIRQYLARRELPLVLIAADAPADSLSGARDSAEIVRRLRAQAPRMRVVVMTDSDEAVAEDSVRKPSLGELSDPRAAERRLALGQGLRAALPFAAADDPSASADTPAASESTPSVEALREASARIREPGGPGEVLDEVLDFAGRTFDRVALFMVREGRAIGLGQRGLPESGGPDDVAIRALSLSIAATPWLQRVLDSRAPERAQEAEPGDRELAALLGRTPPREAFVAPIESSGQVVALIYGDMLPSQAALPNTGALEVVLHQAGLALDRAALEGLLGEG